MKIQQIPTPVLGGPSNGGGVSMKAILGVGPKGNTGAKGDKGDTGDVTPAATAAKTAAETARDAATAAKTAAETARDQAVAVGTTNDGVIAGRINDPASATRTALNDSYVGIRDTTGAPVTGHRTYVVLDEFGDIDNIVSEAI